MLNMTLTCDTAGTGDRGFTIAPGDKVEYIAHVPGGMVRVRLRDGRVDVFHPHCFPILRDKTQETK